MEEVNAIRLPVHLVIVVGLTLLGRMDVAAHAPHPGRHEERGLSREMLPGLASPRPNVTSHQVSTRHARRGSRHPARDVVGAASPIPRLAGAVGAGPSHARTTTEYFFAPGA